MEKVNTKFTLRETLQFIIPGIYFMGLFNNVLQESKTVLFLGDSNLNIIISILFSLIIGMLIYAIDIPKRLCFFKNNLPISLIKKQYNIDVKINNFFDFYDEKISIKQKNNTEKYTSIYHFSVNVTLVSFIFSLVYAFLYKGAFFTSYGLPVLIILVLGLILTLQIFFGKDKIKDTFERQAEKYYNSILKENQE